MINREETMYKKDLRLVRPWEGSLGEFLEPMG